MCSMNVVSRRLGALTLLAMSLGHIRQARGESPREAEGLFQEGRAALAREEFGLAASYFDRSYQLDPALGTLLNLAFCEEKLGKLTAALAHLRKAREKAPSTDRRLPLVDQRIAELETRVPRLTIRPSQPIGDGVTLYLDQRPLAPSELGTAIGIDPGPHVLNCAGLHQESCANVLSVSEGEEAVLIVTVTTPPPPAPVAPVPEINPAPPSRAPTSVPSAAPRFPDRKAAYIVGGIGVATVVVGLVAGGGAIRQKNNVDAHCDDRGCDSEGLNAATIGSTLATVSTITTVLGVTTLGVSTYLFLTAPTTTNSAPVLSVRGSF
jgi:hypothetical protein